MQRLPVYLLSLPLILILPGSLAASELQGLVGLGVEDGGDTLYHGYYGDGEYAPVKAGGDISYFFGGQLVLNDGTKIRTTFGVKKAEEGARNGEVTFSRNVFELSYIKSLSSHNLGAGITYHTDVKFNCNLVDICNYTTAYDESLGFTLQYEYDFSLNTSYPIILGIKYTSIEYTPKTGDPRVDGSSLGLYIGGVF